MKTLFRAAAVGALILAGTVGASGVAMAQTAPVAAESAFKATTLNLSAYGEARQTPDMATITLGVTTEAPSEVARYASLLLSGTYASEYLRVGLVED